MRGGSFVGRTEELRIAERAIADAAAGQTRVVLLTGEAGVGKTSLALEAARRASAHGTRLVVGRAWEASGAPAFWLWQECLRELGDELPVATVSVGDDARFAALAAIVKRVRDAARDAPTVFVLDDVQWADVPSLHALKLLARTARTDRLCVIGTVRQPNDAGPDVATALADVGREGLVLALGGLERGAIAELARERGVDRDAAVDVLARATGGNALFAVELLADREARAALAQGDAVRAPRGVRDVLSRHLARLGAGPRAVVAWAAVGGDPVDAAAIASASGLAPTAVAEAIDVACDEQILARASGGLRFAHDLFRSVAYEEIAHAERAAMHQAFARVLGERDPRSTQRIAHLLAASPHAAGEDTARAALEAADAALRRYAYEEATSLLGQAAAVFERGGKRAEHALALALLAEASFLRGDVEGAAREAERALAVARESGDAVAHARAALALGLRRFMGLPARPLVAALDEALEKLDAAGIDDVALRCAVEARLGAALQPILDPPRALATARRAIARARAAGEPELVARTLHAARPAFRILEPLEERASMDGELLALSERLGDRPLAAHAHTRVFWTALEAGDVVRADLTLEALEDLARELRLPSHELAAQLARCVRHIMSGRFAEAERVLAEAEATRERWAPAVPLTVDPLHVLRMNLFVAGSGPLVEAPATFPQPMREMIHVSLFARAGRVAEAAAAFPVAAEQHLRGEPSYMARTYLADACARLGATTHADRLYELCLPFEGRHVVWTPVAGYDGSVDRLLGGLASVRGDRAAALRHYDRAIAMEESVGAVPFARRTREERAKIAAPAVAIAAVAVAPVPGDARPSFVREGETWLVSFGTERTRMKDADGLRYLAYLVARPNVPVPAAELFAERASARGEVAPPSGDGGEVLDRTAIARYRERARDLREALSEAEARNDHGAMTAARAELAFLEEELSRGVGLGGRARRASSDQEKIRINVTLRIRKAIDKLRADAPGLAKHLDRAVKTGNLCSYEA
jgi:tetratricopeptide (TPR) repeat protein